MATKPTYKPLWAQNDTTLPNAGTDNKLRPTSDLRDAGIDYGQQLTAQEFNWVLNNIREWIDYLEADSGVQDAAIATSDSSVTDGAEASVGISSYNSEDVYWIKWPFTSTTATPKLNLDGLGPQTIVALGGAALEAGDLQNGYVYPFWYNGSNFVVVTILKASQVPYDSSSSNLTSNDVKAAVDELDSKVGVSIQDIFPIGSVAFRPTNPGNSVANGGFGFGTWQQIKGKVLVGVGSNADDSGYFRAFSEGDTGGEYEHELTEAEMPSHTHYTGSRDSTADEGGDNKTEFISSPGSEGSNIESTASGGSASHNNVQPYFAVYMWYRTA